MEITRIYGNRKDSGIEVVQKNIDVFKKYNKGIKEQKQKIYMENKQPNDRHKSYLPVVALNINGLRSQLKGKD